MNRIIYNLSLKKAIYGLDERRREDLDGFHLMIGELFDNSEKTISLDHRSLEHRGNLLEDLQEVP